MKFIKSRKLSTILLIVLSILLELLGALLYFHWGKKDCTFMEILYYFSQFISSIFVISGVIIAVWQYYLSSKNTKTNLEIMQVQRAIDLSEYYKDNILNYFPAIRYIFSQVGITDIFENISIDKMIDFDSHELEKLLTPAQIQNLQNIQYSNEFLKAVLEANDIYGLNLHFRSLEVEFEKEGRKGKIMRIDKTSLSATFMSNLLNAVLNNLEFFALHFRHNTADESVVYQSLHQSYLRMIPYLYYYIAKQNTDSSNKLYTNVVWLFREWKFKKEIQESERSIKSLSVQSHGTIIANNY